MKLNSMPVITFLLSVLVVLVILYVAYLFFFPHANPPLPQNAVTIGSHTFQVEIASTTLQKTLGLSGRDGLGDGEGMLFLFSDSPGVQNFWMKDMKFSIDIIWIAGNKVVGFAEDAAPQPGVPLWGLKIYSSPDYVDKVLEV